MSKLVLLFVCLAVFAYSDAALVKRDAPTTDTGPKTLEEAFNHLGDFLKTTFSEDQIKKFGTELQDISAKIQSSGKEFLEQAEAKIKKLQEANEKPN